nr:hypothetical protein [Tanacetum cinerariifolium]
MLDVTIDSNSDELTRSTREANSNGDGIGGNGSGGGEGNLDLLQDDKGKSDDGGEDDDGKSDGGDGIGISFLGRRTKAG